MNILLIESSSGGHYVSLHLKSIVESFKKKNFNIYFLISNETKNSESFKKIKNIKKENIFTFDKPRPPIIKKRIFFLINQIIYYFNLKNNYLKINKKFDFIHINTLDHFDKALAIFNSPFKNTPFSGQLNHPTFHLKTMKIKALRKPDLINLFFFKLLLKTNNLKTIFTIDPLLKKYLYQKNNLSYKNIKTIPVAAVKNVLVKKIPQQFRNIFLKKEYFILVYGAVRESKNVLSLINALKFIKYDKVKVIIAGKVDKDFKSKLSENIKNSLKLKKKIILIDRFISEKETTILFKKCNLVWLCYKNDHFTSSSVFFKAAMNNKNVFACNHGLIKFFIQKYKIGPTVDPSNKKQINKELENLYKKKKKYIKKSTYFEKNYNPEIIGELIVKDTLLKA